MRGYDYSRGGAYFVTVCVEGKRCLLENEALSCIVEEVWYSLPNRYARALLDAFVIMPNHVHGILLLSPRVRADSADQVNVGAAHEPPSSLSMIIGFFKMKTAKRINAYRKTPGSRIWQRGFYDRIVRNDEELFQIRQYIANNPKSWDVDRENPSRIDENEVYSWLYD